jgi:hypothetical protein
MALAVTDDYHFTDSIGSKFEGRDNLRTGWDQYLSMFPDYNIEVDHVFCDGDSVAVFGVATGTYANTKWSLPASWRATVRDGSILSWQIYADNGPVREILDLTAPQKHTVTE